MVAGEGSRAAAFEAPDRARIAELVRRVAPRAYLAVAALLATFAYGHGNIIGEGDADLHIDPLHFIAEMRYTWDPQFYLGYHNGATQVYLTPYTFLYGLFALVHTPAELGQRCVLFLIYLWIVAGMYWALGRIVPGISTAGRLAGASAYLFNIYVAFNSQGSVPMLLAYASLPCILAAIAAALDGAWSALSAGAAIALFTFFASGNNPPLIAIELAICALFIIVYFVWSGAGVALLRRLAALIISGTMLSVALNLYWIVPFLGFMRTVWMPGVLDESPAMHNADSSFANVFRGLGQWSIFQSDSVHPYFTWAHVYQTGQIYSFLLWLVPLFGIAALLIRPARSRALLFFLLAAFISIPLAVGYYRGPLGDAVTEPVYNYLYNFVPGFQMFRSAYKWVWPYELGAAGLFAIFVWRAARRRPAAQALVLLPLIVYIPIIINKANYPMIPLPSWTHHESAMVGTSPASRVALFPSQYLERFLWGEPSYYMEHALIRKPMTFGYLGAATNEAADEWLRLAYRRAREGDPSAANIFRALSVSEFLQRDDFRNDIDFAFPDVGATSNATVSHDILTRVIGATPAGTDGANRLYKLAGALPMIYASSQASIGAAPAAAVPFASSVERMAAGKPQISIDGLTRPQIAALTAAGFQRSALAASGGDYADTLLLPRSTHVEVQHAGQVFRLPRSGVYRIVAIDLGLDRQTGVNAPLLDGRRLSVQRAQERVWHYLGSARLRGGVHRISAQEAGYVTPLLVAFIDAKAWNAARTQIAAVLPTDVRGAASQPRMTEDLLPLYRTLPICIVRATAGELSRAQLRAVRVFDLPYLPAAGVQTPNAAPLPASWYARAETYEWNRGSAVQWLRLRGNAIFDVYSPARGPVRAVMRMRFTDPAKVHYPQVRTSPLLLRPGKNAVHVNCNCLALVSFETRDRAVAGGILHMIAPLPVRHTPMGAAIAPNASAGALAGASLQLLSAQLAGDPFVSANAAAPQSRNAGWIAEQVQSGEHLYYRLFPVDQRDGFNAPIAQDLPDTSSDMGAHVAGAWVIPSRSLTLVNVTETRTAMPEHGQSQLDVGRPWVLPKNANALKLRARGASALLLLEYDSGAGWRLAGDTVTLSGDSLGSAYANADLVQEGFFDDAAGAPGVHALYAGARSKSTFVSIPSRWTSLQNGNTEVTLPRYVLQNIPAGARLRITARGRATILPPQFLTTSTGNSQRKLSSKVDAPPIQVRYAFPVHAEVTLMRASAPFLLVLNQEYYPQWVASIGKLHLLHVHANGFANAWLVPASAAGTEISLDFTAQRSFDAAVIISLIALFGIIAILWFTRRRPA